MEKNFFLRNGLLSQWGDRVQGIWRRYTLFCFITGSRQMVAAEDFGITNIIAKRIEPSLEICLQTNDLFL